MLYEAARERIASFIGAAAEGGGRLHGGRYGVAQHGGLRLGRTPSSGAGDNILVSEMEHHSQHRAVADARRSARGPKSACCRSTRRERLMHRPACRRCVDDRTRVVAVTQASNTLGTRPDLRPVVDSGAPPSVRVVVVDGCQGVVHGGVDVAGAGLRLLRLLGPQTLRPDGYRRAVRQARTARPDASVPRRRRHGRYGCRSRRRPMRPFR